MSDNDLAVQVLTLIGDFREEVTDRMAIIKEAQAVMANDIAGIKGHLAKLNSKVATHERELGERRTSCPLVDAVGNRVRPLEDSLIAQRADGKWRSLISPLVMTAYGVAITTLAFLALLHANEVLKLFTK